MLSSKFNVYRNEWLELVFANRNQSYGAFDLRKNYEKTLAKALFVATAFFVTVVCSPFIYSKFVKKAADEVRPINRETVVVLSTPKKQEKLLVPVEKTAGQKVAAGKNNTKTIRYTPPRVVPAEQVTIDLPDIKQLQGAAISNVTQEGVSNGENLLSAQGHVGGDGVEGAASGENGEPVSLDVIEKYPEFPGGIDAFIKFLRKHLRYPHAAAESGVQGRVILSFVVEKDGSLTDIDVVRGIGFGCDEEAVRVLKKSPLWSAGIQNQRKVRVRYTMPIVFHME